MVEINGKEFDAAGKTLSDYLKTAGFDLLRIAVELNGEILPKAEYDKTVLKNGDNIEVVRFVGGG